MENFFLILYGRCSLQSHLSSITQGTSEGRTSLTVVAVEHSKVTAVLDAEHREKKVPPTAVAVEGLWYDIARRS